jgi:hypothetical protein
MAFSATKEHIAFIPGKETCPACEERNAYQSQRTAELHEKATNPLWIEVFVESHHDSDPRALVELALEEAAQAVYNSGGIDHADAVTKLFKRLP